MEDPGIIPYSEMPPEEARKAYNKRLLRVALDRSDLVKWGGALLAGLVSVGGLVSKTLATHKPWEEAKSDILVVIACAVAVAMIAFVIEAIRAGGKINLEDRNAYMLEVANLKSQVLTLQSQQPNLKGNIRACGCVFEPNHGMYCWFEAEVINLGEATSIPEGKWIVYAKEGNRSIQVELLPQRVAGASPESSWSMVSPFSKKDIFSLLAGGIGKNQTKKGLGAFTIVDHAAKRFISNGATWSIEITDVHGTTFRFHRTFDCEPGTTGINDMFTQPFEGSFGSLR